MQYTQCCALRTLRLKTSIKQSNSRLHRLNCSMQPQMRFPQFSLSVRSIFFFSDLKNVFMLVFRACLLQERTAIARTAGLLSARQVFKELSDSDMFY